MLTIQNDIKDNRLKNVYLLYGEERYLVLQYRDKLLNAMGATGDEMNFSRFEGNGISASEVIDLAETLPFFADYRTILIVNSKWFKTANEYFCDFMKKAPETTRFIFVEEEVDRRNKLFKLVNEKGRAVEFKTQNEQILRKWILGRVGKENKQITTAAMELFLEKTGTDMNNIATELEKLFCYTADRSEIHEGDVEAVVTKRMGNHIFDMISAIGQRQQARALNLYYELLAQKEPPMKILSLLARQFNSLLEIKELRKKGYDSHGIEKKMNIASFLVNKYAKQAAMFSVEELKQAVSDAAATDQNVKSGKIVDRLAVELLIVRYSAPQKQES